MIKNLNLDNQQNAYSNIIQEKVQERQKQAQEYLEKGDIQQAIAQFSKIIFLQPKNSQIYKDLGNVYKKIQDYTAAIQMYRKSYSIDNHVETEMQLKELIVSKGMMLLEQGEYLDFLLGTQFEQFQFALEFSLKDLGQAKEQKSSGFKHYIRALCFMQLSYKQYALQELDQALQLDDKFCEALLLKGKILWSLNMIAEGNQMYWKVENIQPEHPEIEEFLKIIIPQADSLLKETRYLMVQNELDKCTLNVKKGLELFPNNTQFLLIKGFIYRKQGDYEQGLSTLLLASQTLRDQQMQVEVNNQVSLTFNEMGIISYKREQYQEAIGYFNQSIYYKPEDWSCLANLGDCYRVMNQPEEALQKYEQAKQYTSQNNQDLNSRISVIKHSIGIKYFNKQKWAEALKNFDEAVSLNKTQSTFYQNRGKCLLEMGRQQEAIQDFIDCNKLDPKNHEIATIINQLKMVSTKAKKKNVIILNRDEE